MDRLVLAFGKHVVHIVAVEVDAADIAFQMKMILGLWHSKSIYYATKLSPYKKVLKDGLSAVYARGINAFWAMKVISWVKTEGSLFGVPVVLVILITG